MKRRHQRGALTTGGHVPAAKVGDGGDAGAFGNDVGVADLEGGRSSAVRMVIDGLTVAADGADVGRADVGLSQQGERGVGEYPAELHILFSGLRERGGLILSGGEVSGSVVSGVGITVFGEQCCAVTREWKM